MCNELQHPLSPSAAARWCACPGSEYIIPRLPRLSSTAAADEGTLAHEFAAHRIALAMQDATDTGAGIGEMPSEPEAAFATDEMLDGAQIYADAICAQCGRIFSKPFNYGIEMPVGLNDGSGCWLKGRLDFGAWNEEAILIADYKFGGEYVPAKDNPQLLCYAMCIADAFIRATGKSPRAVYVGIIQPRTEVADFSRAAVWHGMEWSAFYEDVTAIRGKAQAACNADEKTLRKTGDHCRWCAARSVCRAAIGERLLLAAIAAGEAEMTEDATDAQIGTWLDALRGIDVVREDLSRIAKARIAAGETIPGWHVQNRRSKQWCEAIREAPTVQAKAQMIANAIGGHASDYVTEALKTPAAVGKSIPSDALAPIIEETIAPALVSAGGKK